MAEDMSGAAQTAPSADGAPSVPDAAAVQSAVSAEQKAISAIGAEAERKQLDESPFAGGRFLVNGKYVDAEGKPHKNQKDS